MTQQNGGAPDGGPVQAVDTVVLDVDGTLVDSVFTHVEAWMRAFRGIGVPVEAWRIHRAIGMGGDKLVPVVAGERVEEALGDQVTRRAAGGALAGIADAIGERRVRAQDPSAPTQKPAEPASGIS